MSVKVAPEKTALLRFSRFQASRKRRFTFLGFEFYWEADSKKNAPGVAAHGAQEVAREHQSLQGLAQSQPLPSIGGAVSENGQESSWSL